MGITIHVNKLYECFCIGCYIYNNDLNCQRSILNSLSLFNQNTVSHVFFINLLNNRPNVDTLQMA